MNVPSAVPELDLTACDREPIHIPGSIQPHGLLVAISSADHRITRASANIEPVLGLAPTTVLGRRLEEAVPFRGTLVVGECRAGPGESGIFPGTVSSARDSRSNPLLD